MIRHALFACVLAGCWRGDPPPPANVVAVSIELPDETHYPWASVAAVHDCTTAGPDGWVRQPWQTRPCPHELNRP